GAVSSDVATVQSRHDASARTRRVPGSARGAAPSAQGAPYPYSSALASGCPGGLGKGAQQPKPPATTTLPFKSSVAVGPWRAVAMLAAVDQAPYAGSYSSALA